MHKSTLRTSKKRRSSEATEIWSSHDGWQSPPASLQAGVALDLEQGDYDSPLAKLFLPNEIDELCGLRGKEALVRDGLIGLLRFFDRYPQPIGLKKHLPELLIHEQWLSFVPLAWEKYVRLFRLVSAPEKSLLQKPLPIAQRKQWVTHFRFDELYCGVHFLASKLESLSRDRSITRLQKSGQCIGFFENGDGSCLQQMKTHRLLNAFLRSEPRHLPLYQLLHATDMRDCLILDLNEKLRCADATSLQLFYSRGAIEPRGQQTLLRNEEFVRLSPFHGFALRNLPKKRARHWNSLEFTKLRNWFFEKYNGEWITPLCQIQNELF